MRRGPWHQFGHQSQRLALEQLEAGTGEGVIISSRDLTEGKAAEYAPQYVDAGGDVLWDPQFYVPDATLGTLDKWNIAEHRQRVSGLNRVSPAGLGELAKELRRQNAVLKTAAVIAPAVIYEAGRPEIADLNAKLFGAAKQAGDDLGKPTYATIVVGDSAANADTTADVILSAATALPADGWYLAYEFPGEQRLPTDPGAVFRACRSGLRLALTGHPVLHGYAGPFGLLSPGWGATGVGIGHHQNLWQFKRTRFDTPPEGGGGGDAPVRHFSDPLWGTIVDPDELTLLSPALRQQVVTDSPYQQPRTRQTAGKHLVCVICDRVRQLLALDDPAAAADAAIAHLAAAAGLYQQVRGTISQLKDNADAYHLNWRSAMQRLREEHGDDYDYLAMLG